MVFQDQAIKSILYIFYIIYLSIYIKNQKMCFYMWNREGNFREKRPSYDKFLPYSISTLFHFSCCPDVINFQIGLMPLPSLPSKHTTITPTSFVTLFFFLFFCIWNCWFLLWITWIKSTSGQPNVKVLWEVFISCWKKRFGEKWVG